MNIPSRAYCAGMLALALGWSFACGQYALAAPRMPRLPRLSTVLGGKEAPAMLLAADIGITFLYGIVAHPADGANDGGAALKAWAPLVGVWTCAGGGFCIAVAIWENRRRSALGLIERAKRASPRTTIAAGIAIILVYGIPGGLAYGMNDGGATLASWVLHMAFWGCASGAFGIAAGVWKWHNPSRNSRRRSKPSNVIRKSLRHRVTHAFLDDQLIFTAPCPGIITGLRGRGRHRLPTSLARRRALPA